MRNKNNTDWADWALRAAALFLYAGLHFWFHPCAPKEDGSYMLCHWAGRGAEACALVLLLFSVALLIVKKEAAKAALSAAMIPVAVLGMLFPGGLIPLCMMPEMRCRSLMRPAVLLTGSLILILAAVSALIHAKRSEKTE